MTQEEFREYIDQRLADLERFGQQQEEWARTQYGKLEAWGKNQHEAANHSIEQARAISNSVSAGFLDFMTIVHVLAAVIKARGLLTEAEWDQRTKEAREHLDESGRDLILRLTPHTRTEQ